MYIESEKKLNEIIENLDYDKLINIKKKALKFIKYIEKEYGQNRYPLYLVLNKSLKYKSKYNLNNEEFEVFKYYYNTLLNVRYNTNDYTINKLNTKMFELFGDNHYSINKINIKEEDKYIANKILNLYDNTRLISHQVISQTLFYDENIYEKPQFQYNKDPKIVNYLSYVHPVLAAMFIPNIKQHNEYFLLTNLSYIFKCKYEGNIIESYHNMVMIYNLISDNTDIVCDAESPIKDILNRILLQINLWQIVLKLRQGMFYDTYDSIINSNFMTLIDNCKISTYDAPDLLMIGDENVILRRLLNSLAYRCVTIATYPTLNNKNIEIDFYNVPITFTQITKIPIFYIKLPIINHITNNINKIILEDTLTMISPIMTNGNLEYSVISIVDTNGSLIISVPRRVYKPINNNLYNIPQIFNFSNMPHHSYGYEMINNYPVYCHNKLEIKTKGKEILYLKSIVVLKETEEKNNKFIIGTKTLILKDQNKKILLNELSNEDLKKIIVYDPINNHNLREWDDTLENTEDFLEKSTIFIFNEKEKEKNDEKLLDENYKLMNEIIKDKIYIILKNLKQDSDNKVELFKNNMIKLKPIIDKYNLNIEKNDDIDYLINFNSIIDNKLDEYIKIIEDVLLNQEGGNNDRLNEILKNLNNNFNLKSKLKKMLYFNSKIKEFNNINNIEDKQKINLIINKLNILYINIIMEYKKILNDNYIGGVYNQENLKNKLEIFKEIVEKLKTHNIFQENYENYENKQNIDDFIDIITKINDNIDNPIKLEQDIDIIDNEIKTKQVIISKKEKELDYKIKEYNNNLANRTKVIIEKGDFNTDNEKKKELEEKILVLIDKKKELEKTKKDMKEDNDILHTELNRDIIINNELKDKLTILTTSSNDLDKEIKLLVKRLEKLDNEKEEVKKITIIQSLESEKKSLNDVTNIMNSRKTELLKKKDILTKDIQIKEKEEKILNNNIKELNDIIQKLEKPEQLGGNNKIKELLDNIIKYLNESNEENNKKNIIYFYNKIYNIVNTLIIDKTKFENFINLKSKIQTKSKDLEEKKKKILELNLQLKEKEEEIKKLKDELDINNNINNYYKGITNLSSNIVKLNVDIDYIKTEKNKLETEKEENIQLNKSLNNEIEKVNHDIKINENNQNELNQLISNGEKELEELKKLLSDQEAIFNDPNKIKKLEEENKKIRNNNTNLSSEIKKLNSEIEGLLFSLTNLLAKIKNLEEDKKIKINELVSNSKKLLIDIILNYKDLINDNKDLIEENNQSGGAYDNEKLVKNVELLTKIMEILNFENDDTYVNQDIDFFINIMNRIINKISNIENFKTDLKKYKEELNKLDLIIATNKSDCENKERELAQIEKKNKSNKEKNDELKEKIKSILEEIDTYFKKEKDISLYYNYYIRKNTYKLLNNGIIRNTIKNNKQNLDIITEENKNLKKYIELIEKKKKYEDLYYDLTNYDDLDIIYIIDGDNIKLYYNDKEINLKILYNFKNDELENIKKLEKKHNVPQVGGENIDNIINNLDNLLFKLRQNKDNLEKKFIIYLFNKIKQINIKDNKKIEELKHINIEIVNINKKLKELEEYNKELLNIIDNIEGNIKEGYTINQELIIEIEKRDKELYENNMKKAILEEKYRKLEILLSNSKGAREYLVERRYELLFENNTLDLLIDKANKDNKDLKEKYNTYNNNFSEIELKEIVDEFDYLVNKLNIYNKDLKEKYNTDFLSMFIFMEDIILKNKLNKLKSNIKNIKNIKLSNKKEIIRDITCLITIISGISSRKDRIDDYKMIRKAIINKENYKEILKKIKYNYELRI